MPRDVLRIQKKEWSDFVKDVEAKAQKRKPVRTDRPEKATGTLWAIRNKRLTIREGALRLVAILVTYRKITTGEVKKYEVIPVSYRYRRLKIGYRKVLYCWDKNEGKQLKSFVLTNVMNVALTDRKFRPDPAYPIEIG